MSATNSDMKLATMPAPQPKPHLFLDELKVDETGSCINGASSLIYYLIQSVSWIGAGYEEAGGLVLDFQVTHKTYPLAHQNWYQHYRDEEDEWSYNFISRVSLEDHVDPDVNDDTSEDEPTSSKQKWFSHLTVSNKLEASKGANWCLQTHVISDIKSSFKFLVLVNGITLKKLIRKGISPVLKPKVCLSGAAKKKSIVPDIVNKYKQAQHVEVRCLGLLFSLGCNRVVTDGTEIQYVGSIVTDLQVENLFLLQNMLNTVIHMAVDMWTCLIEVIFDEKKLESS
ncbi:hypothetical protein Tco_0222380 [Tanacetum coccineum]